MRKILVLLKVLKREILMLLFGLFPVKRNRVFFMSYYGKYMNCNPYAIYCYLKENDPTYEFVWVYNKKTDDNNIKIAPYRSVKFYYYLRTSQYLIFNARPGMDIHKRKEQFYIQTWHSSLGFKMIEKDAQESLSKSYIKNAIKDSKNIDLLISGCNFRSNCFRRNFWYKGEIAEIGTPRNDIFFSKDKGLIIANAKKELGIANTDKVILYAPTFRNSNDLSYATSLDVDTLLTELKNKYSGEWKFVYRLHPNVSQKSELPKGTIDVSSYKDMQALLLMSDILLTDYSSVMFDFMLLNRPCFLYTPDYDRYKKNERDTYFAISELPFGMSLTNDELCRTIQRFNENEYQGKISQFQQAIGSFENGTACKRIVDIMMKWKEQKL